MALFVDRTGAKLATGPTLLLPADPGPGLLGAARQYDPGMRRWPGRLIFGNGVLLFGPVKVTPKVAEQAGLPSGVTVAWHAAAALQQASQRRSDDAKHADGELLVTGLAARLGGTVHPRPSREPALLASVYSQQAPPPEDVAAVLAPFAGDVTVEDAEDDTYAISGRDIYFYTSYTSPRLYAAVLAPAALGPTARQPQHHWDLSTGGAASKAAPELRLKIAEAALALAARTGGVAIDYCGFRFDTPEQFTVQSR